MNKVQIDPVKRSVELEVVHIESDYYTLAPAFILDEPKERE